MAYLEFNKKELVNLEYSLKREHLSTNHAGGYLNTTIVGCNTRKYHGLLVLPIKNFNNDKHVLLSSLDETLIQHGKEFNLGIHCYGEIYEPRGHKYITNLEIDKLVSVTYAVGGMVLKKVMLLCNKEDQMFISYTLLEAHSPTTLRLKPFLAFRHIHALSKANSEANTKSRKIVNGRSFRMYKGFSPLNLQLNVESEFVSNPDWYYNIEYKEESRRVFDSKEDLFVPGFFEMPIEKGETIIFSASLKEEKPEQFKAKFAKNLNLKKSRDSFLNCLKISANQFIITRGGASFLYIGYPWLEDDFRDTLVYLPGLTLHANEDLESFKAVLETLLKDRQSEFVNTNSQVDVPLWLFWTLQQYDAHIGKQEVIWENYGSLLKEILYSYKNGTRKNIVMHENGLLWAEQDGVALTWMDAYAYGVPITERAGYQIEVNSLWYNAISYAVSLAQKAGEEDFVEDWLGIIERIEKNFIRAFAIEGRDYLADYVGPEGQNKFSRPNQMFTCAFDYSPLTIEERAMVLKNVKKELLTVRGVRTLSPKNSNYKGEYDGDQLSRDLAYHQGTSRVWLLSFYIEGMFKLYGKDFLNRANDLLLVFEEEILTHCIGSVSEVYDGDPPHQPHGATSYSGSVAALLTIIKLIEKHNGMES
ncbi:MAG: glycogen debranching enzyme N-terminal domain-containing protein [Bacteroidales bacterium]